jgi:phytoene dehydrogenase-like protein
MRKNATVIGGGINGLVAANVLARSGWKVELLERKPRIGGACTSETQIIDGIPHEYPLGATVLGMMQDFVLEETGLSERLTLYAPRHPKMAWYPSLEKPVMIWRDPRRLKREFAEKFGEHGAADAFRIDEARVISFLQDGFRRGHPPDLREASMTLGDDLTRLWMTGSAKALLDHYFTDDRTKLYMGMTAIESGPVPIDSPMSAFTIPLMDSGNVFDGYWGFVKGGIWKLTEALAEIDRELGVRIVTEARVECVDAEAGAVRYLTGDGRDVTAKADHVVFATDPRTASELAGNTNLTAGKRFLGSSGKVVMVFRKPIRWKDATGRPDCAASFKFIFAHDRLDTLDAASQAAAAGEDYVPGYYQIYCEGAAARATGEDPSHDRIVVFFKNLAFNRQGDELDHVREDVVRRVLRTIANPGDLAWSRLLTPKDLQREFYFPEGNIDHAMLCDGQQYMARTYAAQPSEGFYRFGSAPNVWYCGAGAYPCGSVAGTPGWMCAQEILRRTR